MEFIEISPNGTRMVRKELKMTNVRRIYNHDVPTHDELVRICSHLLKMLCTAKYAVCSDRTKSVRIKTECAKAFDRVMNENAKFVAKVCDGTTVSRRKWYKA